MKKRKSAVFLSSLAFLVSAGAVHAGSAQANLNVQAHVQDSCKIEVTSSIDFGNYLPDSDKLAQGTIRVTCIKDVAPTVSLLGGGSQVGDRVLSNGTDTIAYTLFQPTDGLLACDPANLLTTWGSGANGLLVKKFTGYVAQDYSVCGKIASGQTALGTGTYTGVVTAQVDY